MKKTITTEEINRFIKEEGGTVSISALAAFLNNYELVTTEKALPENFNMINWLKERADNESISLLKAFKEFRKTYNWSYKDINEKFNEDAADRKDFYLNRRSYSSLSDEEKTVLPIYHGDFVSRIIFKETEK